VTAIRALGLQGVGALPALLEAANRPAMEKPSPDDEYARMEAMHCFAEIVTLVRRIEENATKRQEEATQRAEEKARRVAEEVRRREDAAGKTVGFVAQPESFAPADAVRHALVAALTDPEVEVRLEAVAVLAESGELSALLPAAKDEDPRVRAAALRALRG
jgi:HEAT repeat protein